MPKTAAETGIATRAGEHCLMDPIIRIITAGKPLADIDQGIVDAIQRGRRVLVKAGSISNNIDFDNIPQKLDGASGAIASWAEGLSQEHGLLWQRVGPDVLFTRPMA